MLTGVFAAAAVASAQVCIQAESGWPEAFGKADDAPASGRILSVDGSGYAYVTGQTTDSPTRIGLWKFNASSTALEAVAYPEYDECGCANSTIANAHGMVVLADFANVGPEDPYRRIFVAGTANRTGTSYDVVVSLFHSSESSPYPQLDEVWTCCWNNSEQNGIDYPVAMVLDIENPQNLWVLCASDGNSTGQDIVLLKVPVGGGSISQHYRYPSSVADSPIDIATLPPRESVEDPQDLIFVTGTTSATNEGTNIVTFAVGAQEADTLLWYDVFNNASDGNDTSSAMALQHVAGIDERAVWVCGSSVRSGTGMDFVALKYNADDEMGGGNIAPDLTLFFDHTGTNTSQEAIKIGLADPHGDVSTVYVVGNCAVSGQGLDIVVVPFAADDGEEGDASFFHRSGTLDDRAIGLLVPAPNLDDDIYVVGFSSNGTNADYTILRFAPEDVGDPPVGVAFYSSGGPDLGAAVQFGPYDDFDVPSFPHLYAVGRSTGPWDAQPKYRLLRYEQSAGPCP